MGIDALDLAFRLEKRFGVRIRPGDCLPIFQARRDLTVGGLHEVVCRRLREEGRPVPFASWNGVRLEVGKALGVSPLVIRRSSRLIADLGMS